MKQKVKIDTGWGIIILSCDSKYSFNNKILIENINLTNVPITYNYTQTIPIIYNKNNEFAPLCLLEEFKYDISFKSYNNKLTVFKTLSEFTEGSPLTLLNFDNDYKGFLQFSSYVGKTFIDIYKEEECIFSLPIEIQSRKLHYNNHYPKMIGDLSKYSTGIVFELNSPTYQEFALENDNQSPYEKFMILEHILREEHLPSTIEYLSRNLYSALENIKENSPISFASNITPNDLIDAVLDAEELYDGLPSKIYETKHKDNIDILENRFYKYFLELINDFINELLVVIDEGYAYDKLNTYKHEIEYYLSQKYFNDISKLDYLPLNSQVLQKKEGYRDILSYYLMFEFGFKFNWPELSDKFKGYEKKLYELYEYWCYFKLIEIMKELCDCEIYFEDIFIINNDKMSIKLKEKIIKKFYYEGFEIDLLYNKPFKKNDDEYNSYSVKLIPDYTFRIHKDKNYFIHFDAKYKMYVDSEKFKNEDIVKMHAYKDAIPNSLGAYVIYPGRYDEIFYENENKLESVGIFGLIPGEEKTEKIKDLIKKVITNIKTNFF